MGREQSVVFKLSKQAMEGEGTKTNKQRNERMNTKTTIATAITTRTSKYYAPE